MTVKVFDMNNKIGWLLLSGLIIGPVLGSGIVILPPLVYQATGNWALSAWVVMVAVSFFFAFIFSFLTVLSPGEAGVANAVEKAFGTKIKMLGSLYLMGAGLFGPPAVAFIVEKYLNFFNINTYLFAAIFICLNLFLLLRQITSIGKIALSLSATTALILFLGSVLTLIFYRAPVMNTEPFDIEKFGYGLLLLFWIIVGWEVMGSYSGEVRDPRKNFMKAAVFSSIVIAIVDIVVAAAVQYADISRLGGGEVSISTIITPLFGRFSVYVAAFLTLALCINTYLAFVGGISRLAVSLADNGKLLPVFKIRAKNGAPKAAIIFFFIVHIVQIFMVWAGFTDMEKLIAIADGFFIANATVGIFAAASLFKNRFLKGAAVLLSCFFIGILLFSDKLVLAVITFMLLTAMYKIKRQRVTPDNLSKA